MRTALWLAFWWVGGGLYQQAEEAQQAGRHTEAAQHWHALADAVPEHRLAFQLNEAQALLKADSIPQAEQILERIAPALSGDSLRGARAYHLLGLARTRQPNRLRDAIEPLQKALRLNPTDEQARHNLELVLRRLPPPPPSPPIPPPVYEVERPSPYVPPPTEQLGSVNDYPALSPAEVEAELRALARRERQYLQQLRKLPADRRNTGANW